MIRQAILLNVQIVTIREQAAVDILDLEIDDEDEQDLRDIGGLVSDYRAAVDSVETQSRNAWAPKTLKAYDG